MASGYIKYAQRFYKAATEMPYISNTPASSTIDRARVEQTPYGLIFWVPGIPGELPGRRIHISYKRAIGGPMSFDDWSRWKEFIAGLLGNGLP